MLYESYMKENSVINYVEGNRKYPICFYGLANTLYE